MAKYEALIIGAGGQGAFADAPNTDNEHKIISFAHALSLHPEFTTYIYDKDAEKQYKACRMWNAIGHRNSGDLYNMDVIIVATPDNTHYEILKELVEYKPLLVICEKPLCTDIEQAREIVELYKDNNIPLMVNYTRRFIPYLQELKRKYKNGDFGKMLDGTCFYNKGLMHTGSHMIDFLEWFFDGNIDYKLTEIEMDYRVWQIQLFFEKYFWQEQRIYDMPVPEYYDKHMKYVIDNAYNFLEGKEELLCTGEDALNTLEICLKYI